MSIAFVVFMFTKIISLQSASIARSLLSWNS